MLGTTQKGKTGNISKQVIRGGGFNLITIVQVIVSSSQAGGFDLG